MKSDISAVTATIIIIATITFAVLVIAGLF